jgi:hypothetical protein
VFSQAGREMQRSSPGEVLETNLKISINHEVHEDHEEKQDLVVPMQFIYGEATKISPRLPFFLFFFVVFVLFVV